MQTAMLPQPRAMFCDVCFQTSASLPHDRSQLSMYTSRLSRQASKMQGASTSRHYACCRHNGLPSILTSAAGCGEPHLKGVETSSAAAERHLGAHSPGEADQTADFQEEGWHHLPIMPLSKVKLPQETISLQLFEPRYRLLFKLVKQASSRRFGLVMADQQQGTMESTGSLCELTHYIPVPERRRILVVARVIGRFETRRIISDKPFITAMVQDIADEPPQTFQQAADISAAAMRLWQCMQQVKELAGKLYSHVGPIGESFCDWSPCCAPALHAMLCSAKSTPSRSCTLHRTAPQTAHAKEDMGA
ncbi:TPA: hypothetical protein ACH3X1_012343 [Trebouxia sp. C0004]